MPRQADPQLEQRILDAACRLWSRGGEKALTMRGIAKAAGTTSSLILGEAAHSNVNIGEIDSRAKSATKRFNQSKPKPAAQLRAVHSNG